jgi:hypothetical protein
MYHCLVIGIQLVVPAIEYNTKREMQASDIPGEGGFLLIFHSDKVCLNLRRKPI